MTEKLPVITQQANTTPPDCRLPPDLEAEVVKLKEIDRQVIALARVMDVYMVDGGLGFLLPGIGDLGTSAVKIWLFCKAKEVGVPGNKLGTIAGWALADLTVGMVPIVGDVLDFFIRSNLIASRIVHEHIEQRLERIETARLQAAGITVPVEHPAYRELRGNRAA